VFGFSGHGAWTEAALLGISRGLQVLHFDANFANISCSFPCDNETTS
jgi:hypothetical protein